MNPRREQRKTYEISFNTQNQKDDTNYSIQAHDVHKYGSKLNSDYEMEKVMLMRWVAYTLGHTKLDTLIDYSDGETLIKLVEKLSYPKIISFIEANPKLQYQKLNNLKQMILFLESENGCALLENISKFMCLLILYIHIRLHISR